MGNEKIALFLVITIGLLMSLAAFFNLI